MKVVEIAYQNSFSVKNVHHVFEWTVWNRAMDNIYMKLEI